MPIVICFANMKGGVGKTTLCVNLAFELFVKRKNVLVVDNDPQFNATSALISPTFYLDNCIKKDNYLTIYDIYEKQPRVQRGRRRAIDPKRVFIPVWHIERSNDNDKKVLDLIPSRIELYETLRNPSQKEYLLDKFLTKYAKNYDYILVDCPPTPSVLTLSAFAASDYVIIPVTPDYFSTMGLPQFLGTLKDFKEDLQDNHNIKPLGVVFTNVQRTIDIEIHDSMKRVESALDENYNGIKIFRTRMSHFKVYEKSLWQSVPVRKITGLGQRGKRLAIFELLNIVSELDTFINLDRSK